MNRIPPIAPYLMRPGRTSPFISYLDEVRAQYGSTVYPFDRYVEVFHIRENVWAMYAPCTHTVEDNWIYLIEGPEKALVIDNGFGIGDLRGLCEMLVHGKPVMTAVTHKDLDHSGGSVQWEEVYVHTYDADYMELQMEHYEEAWKDFNHVEAKGWRHYYDDRDIMPFHPYRCIHLEDGDLIRLGEDYDIELIHVGGHCAGEVCFLDRKGRALYTGDSMFETRLDRTPGLGLSLGLSGRPNPYIPVIPHLEAKKFRFYAEKIRQLAKRTEEWDWIGAGHGYFDSPASLVTDMLQCVNAIEEDPHNYTATVETRFGTGYIMQRGLTNIRYLDPDTIRES